VNTNYTKTHTDRHCLDLPRLDLPQGHHLHPKRFSEKAVVTVIGLLMVKCSQDITLLKIVYSQLQISAFQTVITKILNS
jgi:hypothetical protein